MKTLALALLLIASSLSASAQERCRAIDGDTLKCGLERVRLQGIYTSELKEPGGQHFLPIAAREAT